MAAHIKDEGTAFLCFLESNSSFQGALTCKSGDVYSLAGSKSHVLPNHNFHECCFDGTPQFYSIEIALTDDFGKMSSEPVRIENVMRIGGDNCSLHLEDVFEFNTDKLIVGKQASEYVTKYFPKKFANKECYVCIGEMSVNFVDCQL
ncbi:hypothetical protein HELRODRAFT_183182 [Helobdella robusta]|uniref:Uncharacterized protein n=1 Tax=Helobdella robusta TaxID=6412 RepID=T1FJ97_HELRO|nr:hypothetical protein HELRODRAFT_183182 [Helobdella robusta]ESO11398.1 hypothetical protein HELRODRAFT_183182 [Helobdella robusta]